MKKLKLKLYLAHNLYTRKKIRKVELALEKKYNIELANPFYDRKRKHIKKIDKGICTRWEFGGKECIDIVMNDCEMIDNSNGVLAIVSELSQHIGTILEIAYAFHHKKLVYVITDTFYNHPWIRVYANKRFRNFDEFENWLEKEGYKK